jgi:hypothetical protein
MSIAIVVSQITPRLSYTADWIFRQQLGVPYSLLTSGAETEQHFSFVLHYGGKAGVHTIPASGLLSEDGIHVQQITAGLWQELPVLFYSGDSGAFLPFDLLSAVFYLLSRYEEYLPFTPDRHQRFPATESILYEQQLLDRPIIDEWLLQVGKKLSSYGVAVQPKQFSFLPTYDIDIAWSYRHKGWKRTLGGYIRDVAQNNFDAVKERTGVLLGHKADPYDSFSFTDELHAHFHLKPRYFILAATQNGPFDKHIPPVQPDMKRLISKLSAQYELGIHPSYRASRQPDLLHEEQQLLQQITGRSMGISRQHYIRFTMPDTYRNLIDAGIVQDYSMGYGTHTGFRAGTSHQFDWYDLPREQTSALQVFPFCFMDTTAHYDLGLTVEASFEKLTRLQTKLQQTGGLLITIFHNFSLGTAKEWAGWRQHYSEFVKQLK